MRNDLFLKQIGKKIKAARKAKKISLPQLAALSNVDMSNLWFLENGQRNPHILTLKAIADVLETDVRDFI
jgi:transcriptional regulator with XRE-family HTH domain